MNQIYEGVDTIVTKPGGVTIMEAIKKNLQIFIHSYLPGQETQNLQFLGGKDLVTDITNEPESARKIKEILNNERLRKKQRRNRKKFIKDYVNPTQVLLKVLKGNGNVSSKAN
jgi:processive 1,2-diacylglycerol beta-glucosyltransferase